MSDDNDGVISLGSSDEDEERGVQQLKKHQNQLNLPKPQKTNVENGNLAKTPMQIVSQRPELTIKKVSSTPALPSSSIVRNGNVKKIGVLPVPVINYNATVNRAKKALAKKEKRNPLFRMKNGHSSNIQIHSSIPMVQIPEDGMRSFPSPNTPLIRVKNARASEFRKPIPKKRRVANEMLISNIKSLSTSAINMKNVSAMTGKKTGLPSIPGITVKKVNGAPQKNNSAAPTEKNLTIKKIEDEALIDPLEVCTVVEEIAIEYGSDGEKNHAECSKKDSSFDKHIEPSVKIQEQVPSSSSECKEKEKDILNTEKPVLKPTTSEIGIQTDLSFGIDDDSLGKCEKCTRGDMSLLEKLNIIEKLSIIEKNLSTPSKLGMMSNCAVKLENIEIKKETCLGKSTVFIDITDSPAKPNLCIDISESPLKTSTNDTAIEKLLQTPQKVDVEIPQTEKAAHESAKKKLEYECHNEKNTISPKPAQESVEVEKISTEEKIEAKNPEEQNETFDSFIKLCLKVDNTSDMQKIVDMKIKKYYKQTARVFIHSESFKKMLEDSIKQIVKNPENLYIIIREVLDELKARRMGEEEQKEQPVDDEEQSEREKSLDRKIKKLEKAMERCNSMIMRLEQEEVDMDEDVTMDSPYELASKYKTRLLKIYNKLCSLTGEKDGLNNTRNGLKRLSLCGGRIPRLNSVVMATATSQKNWFPDFTEIFQCIQACCKKTGLQLSKEKMLSEAREAFLQIGSLLKKKRLTEEYNNLNLMLESAEDPADNDPELASKLAENRKIFVRKEKEIIDDFALKEKMSDGKLEIQEPQTQAQPQIPEKYNEILGNSQSTIDSQDVLPMDSPEVLPEDEIPKSNGTSEATEAEVLDEVISLSEDSDESDTEADVLSDDSDVLVMAVEDSDISDSELSGILFLSDEDEDDSTDNSDCLMTGEVPLKRSLSSLDNDDDDEGHSKKRKTTTSETDDVD